MDPTHFPAVTQNAMRVLKSAALGGTDAISTVAVAFENRAAKDERINQKFARTDLNRLTKEFVDQLCQDTGGPCKYTGRDLKETRRSHLRQGHQPGRARNGR